VRQARLTAVGHPAVTGRHDKTLELTAEDAITARATCVLGVAAGPLPGELPLLRGRVRLTVAAGGLVADVEGTVNPGYASADRLVVRRSDQADPDTFLLAASAAAADLRPDLLAALARPGTPVEVTVAELEPPAPVLLVLTGAAEAGPAVARLAAQADLVLDLTPRGAPPPGVPLAAPRHHGPPPDLTGLRTVVVLAEDLADADLLAARAWGGGRPRVVVWPPAPGADLLLAAGLPATPLLHAGPLPQAPNARRDLLRRVSAAGVPAAVGVPRGLRPAAAPPLRGPERSGSGGRRKDSASRRTGRDGLEGVLEEVGGQLPEHAVLLPDPVVGWGVGAVTARPGPGAPLLDGLRRAPYAVLVPPAGRTAIAVDPAELVRLLRGAGSTGRDAAAVLTGLGVPRREAYRLAADQP